MVTSPHNPNCGGRCGRVHGVSGEVCWGVGGGEGSCGKRCGGGGEVLGSVLGCGGE